MNMTLTRKRFSIGFLFGVLICVAIGYSIQLPTMTANPFVEHIHQFEELLVLSDFKELNGVLNEIKHPFELSGASQLWYPCLAFPKF